MATLTLDDDKLKEPVREPEFRLHEGAFHFQQGPFGSEAVSIPPRTALVDEGVDEPLFGTHLRRAFQALVGR